MNGMYQQSREYYYTEQTTHPSTTASEIFLEAWKEGVKIAGQKLFIAEHGFTKPFLIDDVCDKRQLTPSIDAIRQYTKTCRTREGVFIGTLVSFYNGDTGAAILTCFGHIGLGDVANCLNPEHLRVITTLMLNHTGW